MASLQASENAQSISVCQICEESSQLKGMCVECDLFLCQTCYTKFHMKSNVLSEHNIIDIKDCGTEQAMDIIRKVDLKNIRCTVHQDQKCYVFCEDCESTICLTCVIQSHRGHKLYELNEFCDNSVKKVKFEKENTKTMLTSFQQEEQKLYEMFLNGKKQYVTTRDSIKQREKETIEAVKDYAVKLLSRTESCWKPCEEAFDQEMKILQQKIHDLQQRQDCLDSIILSPKSSKLLSAKNVLNNSIPEMSIKKIHLNKLQLREARLSVESYFGELDIIPGFEHVHTYQTDLRDISKILTCEKDVIKLGSLISQKIENVKVQNNETDVISKVEQINVYDMALLDNGDIIISVKDSDLRVYTKDGKIKKYHSFSPLITLGVFVNKNDEIVVGLSESKTILPLKQDSIRKIVGLDKRHHVVQVHEYEKDKRLFTWPTRILRYKYSGIFCLDILNDEDEGRVVALYWLGGIKWEYSGGENVTKFYPRDITISPDGLLLVLDSKNNNNTIHVLSEKGNILCCENLQELSISFALSIMVNEAGMLWVGCNTYNVDKKNARIHTVKLK